MFVFEIINFVVKRWGQTFVTSPMHKFSHTHSVDHSVRERGNVSKQSNESISETLSFKHWCFFQAKKLISSCTWTALDIFPRILDLNEPLFYKKKKKERKQNYQCTYETLLLCVLFLYLWFIFYYQWKL